MAALHKLRADAMRGIVVALVVAGLRVAGARRNVARLKRARASTRFMTIPEVALDCLIGTT